MATTGKIGLTVGTAVATSPPPQASGAVAAPPPPPQASVNVTGTGGNVIVNFPATAQFALLNTSNAPATFNVAVTSSDESVTIFGYTLDCDTFTSLANLNAALAHESYTVGAVAPIGVDFIANADASSPFTITLTATAAVPGSQTSVQTGNNTAIETIVSPPNLSVQHVAPTAPVTPGEIATDSFQLKNISGEDAVFNVCTDANFTIATASMAHLPAIEVTGYTLTDQDNHPVALGTSASPLSELQTALADLVVSNNDSITIGVQYTVPRLPKNAQITTWLTATAEVGGVSVAGSDSVTDTVGDPPEQQLEALASTLYAASQQRHISAKGAKSVLDPAAAKLIAIINESEPIQHPSKKLLAWALSIDASTKTILSSVIEKEEKALERRAIIAQAM